MRTVFQSYEQPGVADRRYSILAPTASYHKFLLVQRCVLSLQIVSPPSSESSSRQPSPVREPAQRNNVIPPEVARQDGSSVPLFDQRQSVPAEGANVSLQPDEFAESAVSPQSLGQFLSSELPPAYSPLSEVEGVVVGSMMAEPVLPVFDTLTVYS